MPGVCQPQFDQEKASKDPGRTLRSRTRVSNSQYGSSVHHDVTSRILAWLVSYFARVNNRTAEDDAACSCQLTRSNRLRCHACNYWLSETHAKQMHVEKIIRGPVAKTARPSASWLGIRQHANEFLTSGKSRNLLHKPLLCLSAVRKIIAETRNLTRRTIVIGIWSFDRRIPRFQVAARMPQGKTAENCQ